MANRDRSRHRIKRSRSPSLGVGRESVRAQVPGPAENAVVHCGWGKLVFAHTFTDNQVLADAIVDETDDERNIALYIRDPHVLLAQRPHELFLDPSHTYRLWFYNYRPLKQRPRGFHIRLVSRRADADEINRLLLSRKMIPADADFIWEHRHSRRLCHFVAEDKDSGRIIGTVMGVDHKEAFDDPENGSSMWCLAVDPQARQPGVGRALVAHIVEFFAVRGRELMDLSVMHDNRAVIELYERMGFERVPAFCLKKKNPVNEQLYAGPRPEQQLNPYAEIIVTQARRRGIAVDVLDAEYGYFSLAYGGRSIVCRESLSELTSAVAMSRCDHKVVTHRVLRAAGLRVPAQCLAADAEHNRRFLREHGCVVVKPARGEQGAGVSVGIADERAMSAAITAARRVCAEVVLEAMAQGDELRVILIDYQVVAAALRKPATIHGDARHTVRELIEKQSRRRAAATGGESRIPLDEETERSVRAAGFSFEDILDEDTELRVRHTANLHTGGTLHDVTDTLDPLLSSACQSAARALGIPVVGLDLIVPSSRCEDYVIIEANERPGLANHEPQPTAERFIDLLFPQTIPARKKRC